MAKKTEVVGYAEVAELMNISVAGVQKIRRTEEGFPAPITPPSMKSPGFDRQEIERFIRIRAVSKKGQSGRPVAAGDVRYRLSPETNDKILQRIRAAGTFSEFVSLAGLSDNALRQRLSGKTTWREAEIERFAERLGITLSELTEGERG